MLSTENLTFDQLPMAVWNINVNYLESLRMLFQSTSFLLSLLHIRLFLLTLQQL